MDLSMRPRWALALVVAVPAACVPGSSPAPPGDADRRPLVEGVGAFTGLPGEPARTASGAFWEWWGDGRAEMSGYRITTDRYGEARQGELVLVYVTEPHDRRTWIKDDGVAEPERVEVMKLNVSLKFLTGVYLYSVLTSVFAPVDDYFHERFQPVKVTMSAQEWCGHVHHAVWTGPGAFRSLRISYFADEGETLSTRSVDGDLLYEDALLIQLRELDGRFAGGGDWAGWLVPGLWTLRRTHGETAPVRATLSRSDAELDGVPVTRFVLRYEGRTRTVDVERDLPRRILGWTTSGGEEVELLATERLAYWRLNGSGDERLRAELGLSPRGAIPPERP